MFDSLSIIIALFTSENTYIYFTQNPGPCARVMWNHTQHQQVGRKMCFWISGVNCPRNISSQMGQRHFDVQFAGSVHIKDGAVFLLSSVSRLRPSGTEWLWLLLILSPSPCNYT